MEWSRKFFIDFLCEVEADKLIIGSNKVMRSILADLINLTLAVKVLT